MNTHICVAAVDRRCADLVDRFYPDLCRCDCRGRGGTGFDHCHLKLAVWFGRVQSHQGTQKK